MAQASGRGLFAPGAAVVALAVALAVAQSLGYLGLMAAQPELPARLTADALTGAVSLFGGLVARLAGAAALGLLAAVVAFLPRSTDTESARTTLTRWAVRAAQIWLAAGLLMTMAHPTFILGLPLTVAFTPFAWWTFVSSIPGALAWLVAAFAALVTVLVGLRSRSTGPLLIAWIIGALAVVFVDVTGNVSVGLDHDWASDAGTLAGIAGVLLGSAAVGALASVAVGIDPAAGLVRYAKTTPLLLVIGAGYAVVTWQQLAGLSPFQAASGLPAVIGFCALALLVVSAILRLVTRSSKVRLAGVLADVALLIVGVTSLNAAEHLPPPRFTVPQTTQINYLGYEVLDPPTLARLVGLGRPNLLWVVIVVVGLGLYVYGMVRARKLGTTWPVHRLLTTIIGLGLTGYLAVSGLWQYSTASFSWHMLVHMTVNMLIPILCVIGAPLMLLRAASRPRGQDALAGPTELLDDLAATGPVKILTGAPVLWAMYVFSLFLVYFTPVFPWLMRYHWGHQAMLLYFMATGFAFFNLLLAPQSNRLPYVLRFALLLSVMPFHALFAVGIMMSAGVIGEQFYAMLDIPWVTNLLADQNVAGQITWFTGEVPALIAVVVLAAQWFRSDSRAAAAADRRADVDGDDELAAYNDMLAELASRDAARTRRHDVG